MHDRAESLVALAEGVRSRRRELALTQQEVADLAGVSVRFVHTVEAGKPSLRLDRLLQVLEVLGLGLRLVPGAGLEPPPRHGGETPRTPGG